jgi:hypothetical protein
MNRLQKSLVGAALVGSTMAGGAVGAALFGGSAGAQTTTTVTPDPAATPSTPGGSVDRSNNDPAHEAGETPEQEAAETAGGGHGGFGRGDHLSNHDAAHEAAESPERAAEEAANDAKVSGTTSTTVG